MGLPPDLSLHDTAALPRPARRAALLRWLLLAVIVLAVPAAYAFGLDERLSLEALRGYRENLIHLVERNAALAAAGYILVYVTAVALSFPGASILTIAGGLMFGCVFGTLFALVAATAGATLVFLIARTSVGQVLAERAGPRVQRLRAGFQEEGFSYLLFLRLVPLFPFWLVNLAAALFGVHLLTYVAATALGIVPGTFVLSYFGESLGTAIDGEEPFASGKLLLGLALLGLVALVPAGVRRWRRARGRGEIASG
jgi:uncharacterized membrane protein YdjX (TVP38/TMEM64 family)